MQRLYNQQQVANLSGARSFGDFIADPSNIFAPVNQVDLQQTANQGIKPDFSQGVNISSQLIMYNLDIYIDDLSQEYIHGQSKDKMGKEYRVGF